MKQARGLRNNNPLNIIKSEKINWQGEVKPSTDPNFAQFENGCRTIRQIVARWDPEGPKVIEAYVRTVCKHTGLNPDQQLPPMKEETKVMWCDIVLAMATMECGLNNEGRQSLRPDLEKAWDMLYR